MQTTADQVLKPFLRSKRPYLIGLILLSIGLAAFAYRAYGAIYTYRCPQCGLIQQYDRPGVYKCPKDGWNLAPTR